MFDFVVLDLLALGNCKRSNVASDWQFRISVDFHHLSFSRFNTLPNAACSGNICGLPTVSCAFPNGEHLFQTPQRTPLFRKLYLEKSSINSVEKIFPMHLLRGIHDLDEGEEILVV